MFLDHRKHFLRLALSLGALTLGACTAGTSDDGTDDEAPTFTIGGTLTGLNGSGLVLQLNGEETLSPTTDGAFVFDTLLAEGETYTIAVTVQPTSPAQTCTLSGETGTVATADITSVGVSCTNTLFDVGGTVSGLSGSGLVLQLNGGETLSPTTDGAFVFDSQLSDAETYTVTITSQPQSPAQTCVLSGETGTVAAANITSVGVSCTNDVFAIGGTVEGLLGSGLQIQLGDGQEVVTIDAGTTFAFTTVLEDLQGYDVSVLTQPTSPHQTCVVNGGSGTVDAATVDSIVISCGAAEYYVGGSVSGMVGTIHLMMNGQALVVTDNGDFVFPTRLENLTAYEVEVTALPYQEYCTLGAASGTVTDGDVSNIVIGCNPGVVQQLGGEYFNLDGSPAGQSQEIYDAMGRPSVYMSSDDAGIDGNWFTDDDTYGYVQVKTYDAEGRLVLEVRPSGVGSGGSVTDSDAPLVSYRQWVYDDYGNEVMAVNCYDPGVDGLWLTNDDVFQTNDYAVINEYDVEGRITSQYSQRAGADGQFDTGDDTYGPLRLKAYRQDAEILKEITITIGSSYRSTPYAWGGGIAISHVANVWYDTDGRVWVSHTMYNSGPDGQWFNATDDDYICFETDTCTHMDDNGLSATTGREYAFNTYNAAGQILLQDIFERTVALPMLGDPGHSRTRYNTYSYDEKGIERIRVQFNDPGVDTLWFTSDDVSPAMTTSGSYHVEVYDWATRTSTRFAYAEGPVMGDDGVLGTGDDLAISVEVQVYNFAGDTTLNATYDDPGSDSLWATADDVPTFVYWVLNVPAQSRTYFVNSVGPGSDGLWQTIDDELEAGGQYMRVHDNLDNGRYVERYVTSASADLSTGTMDLEANAYLGRYDALGFESFEAYAIETGSDGLYFTGDDVLGGGYYDYRRDANGNPTEDLYFEEPGPDGQWFTDDDILTERVIYGMVPNP